MSRTDIQPIEDTMTDLSWPPRVASWQVFDGCNDQPIGPATGSEAQAWTLAAEECR